LYRDGAEGQAEGVTDAQGQVLIEDASGKAPASYTVKLSNGNEYRVAGRRRSWTARIEKLAAFGYRAAQSEANNRMQHYLQRRDEEGNP
jgi:hypothetical protein